jgi:hypothetical protein
MSMLRPRREIADPVVHRAFLAVHDQDLFAALPRHIRNAAAVGTEDEAALADPVVRQPCICMIVCDNEATEATKSLPPFRALYGV